MADYANIPPLTGRLVSAGIATLHELRTVYSLEDAYLLDEVLTVRNYHTWLANKESSRNG